MDKTVDVLIPVEPEAAAALTDARNRAAVGRLVSRVLSPGSGQTPLARAIAENESGGAILGPERRGDRRRTGRIQRRVARTRQSTLIVFDASTIVSAALKADSIPERALLQEM